MNSHNEKEKQLIAESKSLVEDITQLLENAEKQKIQIDTIEAECIEVTIKLSFMEDALNKAVTKLEKFKVDENSKLEAKENIQHELIARDEIIKSLQQKLSEANKLTETKNSRPQQMKQEWKCGGCLLTFNSENTLTNHIKNRHQAMPTDNLKS